MAVLLATVTWPFPASEGEDARVARADHAAVAILASLQDVEQFAPAVPEELLGANRGLSKDPASPPPLPSAGGEEASPIRAVAPRQETEPYEAATAAIDVAVKPPQTANATLGAGDTGADDAHPTDASKAEANSPQANERTKELTAPGALAARAPSQEPASGVPVIEASPSSSSSSPSTAIDELVAGKTKVPAIPASTNARLALALPYGESEAKPNSSLPKFVVPPAPSDDARPGGALPQLQPKELEPASVMPGDSNPA
ncbi:MAG: hypothetical protein JO094_01040, partial [Hyphomicrobiales bacterium]|nr:hypothetical protein [Hyphomicrobiales bacterium]